MLAGLSPANIPDLGAIVAKDWRLIYGLMLAGLSSAIISDFAPAVAQDWPANVSIYVDQQMYRSMSVGLSSAGISDIGPTAPGLPAGNVSTALCWQASLLPVSF